MTSALNDVEVLELGTHTRPEWSRLYSPAPIGIGSGEVEGLRSYLYHLAWLHVVSPRTLVEKEFCGLSEKHYRFQGSYFGISEARVINGISPNAVEFAVLTNRLTGRTDAPLMTMLPWLKILAADNRGLLKRYRSWCPKCFAERPEKYGRAYEPLVWSLEPYRFCHHHRVMLATQCPHCVKHQPYIGSESSISHCNACGQTLAGNYTESINKAIPNEEKRTLQEFMTRFTVDLVAHSGHPSIIGAQGKLLRGIKRIIDDYRMFGGGGREFYVNFFGVKKETLSQWTRRRYLPRLNLLILFCAHVRTSPVVLLRSEVLYLDVSRLPVMDDGQDIGVNFKDVATVYKLRKTVLSLKLRKDAYNISVKRLSIITGIKQKVLRLLLKGNIKGFARHRKKKYEAMLDTVEGRHAAIRAVASDWKNAHHYRLRRELVEGRLGLPDLLNCPKYHETYRDACEKLGVIAENIVPESTAPELIDYDWLENHFLEKPDTS